MPRLLWLTFEQISDVDRVAYPATPDHIALVLEFLAGSQAERKSAAERLRTFLDHVRQTSPEIQKSLPCRRPQGLTVLLPWRLAAWLVRVLELPAETVADVEIRLSRWLSGQWETQTGHEEN